MEKRSFALQDRRGVFIVLDRLVHIVQHIQDRLYQIVVHLRVLAAHHLRQVLQHLIDADSDRVLAHQRDFPQRANRLATHFPVAQHRRLLQTQQNGLDDLAALQQPVRHREELAALAEEPVRGALQQREMRVELLVRRREVQEPEHRLHATPSPFLRPPRRCS